jgi:hypothetical protein
MQFDPENHINKLCAQGMQLEGEGQPEKASGLFLQACFEAENDLEKFTAAHYVARHQKNIAEKLKWDETALILALKIGSEDIKATYPSFYLNVGKCYEDLKDFVKAGENYLLAFDFTIFLPNDGYGAMIKSAINHGLERVQFNSN